MLRILPELANIISIFGWIAHKITQFCPRTQGAQQFISSRYDHQTATITGSTAYE
jgi:hypothetical protein